MRTHLYSAESYDNYYNEDDYFGITLYLTISISFE